MLDAAPVELVERERQELRERRADAFHRLGAGLPVGLHRRFVLELEKALEGRRARAPAFRVRVLAVRDIAAKLVGLLAGLVERQRVDGAEVAPAMAQPEAIRVLPVARQRSTSPRQRESTSSRLAFGSLRTTASVRFVFTGPPLSPRQCANAKTLDIWRARADSNGRPPP